MPHYTCSPINLPSHYFWVFEPVRSLLLNMQMSRFLVDSQPPTKSHHQTCNIAKVLLYHGCKELMPLPGEAKSLSGKAMVAESSAIYQLKTSCTLTYLYH